MEVEHRRKNALSFFKKNPPRANQKSKELFSSVSAEALRGGGGVESERKIQFQATTHSARGLFFFLV
ncbi:MAG: hypothetical protein A3G59_01280 [Candidatus Taylorbacteria bacterium RIFCSPLOWO2_12_FULL_47_20]|uniref:Uncharacterized protein n=2 Tax=Candidatus Tayloriibacteriota TaxID=1817919 RepID=A0A1G2P5V2_9BACT|nr:MAG: hypothetical protein A3H68_02510 [Candidatus Taylorbacteria bacterium RIFCSPLOWO2_02_FULL_46_40]OHA43690.1 MAG: hypothetical protein A3G59_01280 [Candidatus Taylorbacteria bacterium RIFCSPLOWO2_12_FULL_47_20]